MAATYVIACDRLFAWLKDHRAKIFFQDDGMVSITVATVVGSGYTIWEAKQSLEYLGIK